MPSTENLNILFVINNSAGADKKNWQAEIEQYFANLSHKPIFFLLDGQSDCKEIKKIISKNNIGKVVAVGGDGTVKLVAQQIIHTKVALGIIPGGSANGMARELGIPENMEEALEIILTNKPSPIDTLIINNKDICLHLSDVGLNAQLINYFEKGNKRGMFGYASVALKTLLHRQQLALQIQADGRLYERTAFMAVLANARMYGTGAMINPKGNLHDGLFEIVLVKKLSVLQILKMMLRHKKLDESKIEIIQTKEVTIQLKRPAHFQVDGEHRGKTNKVKAKIDKAALLVIAGSPAT